MIQPTGPQTRKHDVQRKIKPLVHQEYQREHSTRDTCCVGLPPLDLRYQESLACLRKALSLLGDDGHYRCSGSAGTSYGSGPDKQCPAASPTIEGSFPRQRCLPLSSSTIRSMRQTDPRQQIPSDRRGRRLVPQSVLGECRAMRYPSTRREKGAPLRNRSKAEKMQLAIAMLAT